jgi:hypothetical protein
LFKKNVKVGALVFDGFMVVKESVSDIHALLIELEDVIKNNYDGLEIKLLVKKMTEGIIIPNESPEQETLLKIINNPTEYRNLSSDALRKFRESFSTYKSTLSIHKEILYENRIGKVVLSNFNNFCESIIPFTKEEKIRNNTAYKERQKSENLNLRIQIAQDKEEKKQHKLEIQEHKDNVLKKQIEEAQIVLNDDEASRFIYEEIKHILKKSQGRLFLKDGNKWISSNQKEISNKIINICLRHDNIKTVNQRDKIVPYCKNVQQAKQVSFAVMLLVKDEPNFEELFHSSTKGKLCFKNGVYDFKTHRLTPWSENENVYTTIVIPNDYNENVSCDDEQKAYTIVESIYSTDSEYHLKYFSRGLARHTEDKNVSGLISLRDSGKGVTCEAYQNSFSDYIGFCESENLLCERNSNKGDNARKNAWLIPFQYNRIVFSNEIDLKELDKDKVKINGIMLKKFACDGDEIIARGLYQDEIRLTLDASLVLCVNDIPEISVKDAHEHFQVFNLRNKFVSDEEMKENPHINVYRKKNPLIKEIIKEKWFIDAFRSLLFKAYQEELLIVPQNIKQNVGSVKDEEDILKQIYKDFKHTDNVEEYVLTTELVEYLKGKNMTKDKLQGMLINMGGVKKEKLKLRVGNARKSGIANIHIITRQEKEEKEEKEEK